MARFFGLVKNEYIKILRKTSTKIMLVIILLAAFAFSGFFSIIKRTASSEYYESTYSVDYITDYKEQIDWLEQTKPEGYEYSIECYQFLIDNDISWEDWRYKAVMSIDGTEEEFSDSTFDELFTILGNNDWKSYCQFMMNGAQTEGEKWAYAYRIENEIGFGEEFDKQNTIIEKVAAAKNELEMSGDTVTDETIKLKDSINLGIYQLDHKIYENTADMTSLDGTDWSGDTGFWNVFMLTSKLVSVVGLVILVIAGGTVASEFNQGTIKFLLINPVKRWKILMSKYFTCISLGYLLIALTFIISIPAVGVFHGFSGMSTPYLYVSGDSIHEVNSFAYAALSYLISSINVVVIATFAFAISSLIRSSALAIGTSVFLMFGGSTLTGVLASFGQDWARFLVFANTDLLTISRGDSMFPEHSLTFAVCVLAAHMIVFILTAWDGFTKRSV